MCHIYILNLTSSGCVALLLLVLWNIKMKWNKIDWHFDALCVRWLHTTNTLQNYKLDNILWMHAMEMMVRNKNKHTNEATRQKQDPNMTMTDKHLTYCQKPYKSKWNAICVKCLREMTWHFSELLLSNACVYVCEWKRVSEWVWIGIRNKTKFMCTTMCGSKKIWQHRPPCVLQNSQQKYGERKEIFV